MRIYYCWALRGSSIGRFDKIRVQAKILYGTVKGTSPKNRREGTSIVRIPPTYWPTKFFEKMHPKMRFIKVSYTEVRLERYRDNFGYSQNSNPVYAVYQAQLF